MPQVCVPTVVRSAEYVALQALQANNAEGTIFIMFVFFPSPIVYSRLVVYLEYVSI